MYQCIIPPRLFLSVGVGLLIFSLVLGWISFSVPDWLEYYDVNHKSLQSKSETYKNTSQNDPLTDLTKFGLWRKCVYAVSTNDFSCATWNNNKPNFVFITQVLITLGLAIESLSLLCTIIGFMSRRTFIIPILFASLFAFLSFIFITIGVTLFATESLVYVERLHFSNNETPRRWALWLFIPNLVLSFMSSIFFILASISNWCEYRRMQATGILSHAAEKYGGSVFKAPSDSATNITSTTKKQNYSQQQHMTGQDYPNTCYQINGSNNTQNPLGYPPPPPSYGAPMHQTTTVGSHNPGLFGYSRPPSPTYPHLNLESYHHRQHMNDNSDVDESSRVSVSRRHSRSCRHSSRRSRSHSPRESSAGGNNNSHDKTAKQPQFIPIPVPYYQPPTQPLTMPQPTAQTFNNNANNNNNNNPNSNTTNQPISYIMQAPKQYTTEELMQPTAKVSNMLTYGSEKPSLFVSNPTQPVYTIAYRANNGGNILTSNFLNGPAATTYVTATRDQIAELNSLNDDSDNEERSYRTIAKKTNSKKNKGNEIWTWRKL